MIRILQSVSRRERVMLSAFLTVMLLLWGSSLWSRWNQSSENLRQAKQILQQQNVWIDNAPIFEGQMRNVMNQIDRSKMLNANELTGFIDSYARDKNLRHELGTPSVGAGTVFRKTTLRVTFRNVELQQLIELHLALNQQRPYIAVEALALTANRADPRLLNARLQLSSIEVSRSAHLQE